MKSHTYRSQGANNICYAGLKTLTDLDSVLLGCQTFTGVVLGDIYEIPRGAIQFGPDGPIGLWDSRSRTFKPVPLSDWLAADTLANMFLPGKQRLYGNRDFALKANPTVSSQINQLYGGGWFPTDEGTVTTKAVQKVALYGTEVVALLGLAAFAIWRFVK